MTICPPLKSIFIPLALSAIIGLSACTPGTVAGGTASVGVAIAQERTIGTAIDDTVISSQILSNLYQFDLALLQRVSVEVIEGRVLLTGIVDKPESRVDAVRLAWQVDGVTEVLNEIQVTDQGGVVNYAKDAWISTQLHTKLLLDKEISAINYNIETVNGIVYIIGIAQNNLELERVTNHARTIENVSKVVSHVRIMDPS